MPVVDDLVWFKRAEFDAPDKLTDDILTTIDAVRDTCGISLIVTSDWRSLAAHHAIYPDPNKRPNSPHPRGTALDFKPKPWTPANRMTVLWAILDLWKRGKIPFKIGLEIATSHFHLDVNDPELKRPYIWTGKSK